MNLNDFEKAVTGSRLKKAPFDKAFTDCFLNPLQFVPVKTVDTEVEENVKQTDTDIDEYTRMIRVRSDIINAQLKILLKESEQSTRETTANLGIPVSSTNNSDSSDTSDDSIDEKPRACLSARVDKGLKWPLLLNKWEAHFRSNDLFADNGELNSDLLERVFGSTDCSDWLSRMCCSNIKPNISAKTIVQENSKASLTVASITNSMSATIDSMLLSATKRLHGNDLSSFVQLIRPFSFASTQSNLNEAEMNNTSVCILSCTSDSVEAKPGDFIESDDRSAETNVYPTMNYSPSDYIRSLSEATVSENMTPKVIERTPQPIIITSNPKRKRHILSECKTSYPALDFGQVANYKLPRFPAWQAKYLHHQNYLRSCLCDASSRRKLVYKDACDLLVPMLQIISRPWRQADSKLANLSYSALASDICSIVVETIDMDVPEPAFANTLQEFEVAYKEAESMLDWDQAMRDVESDNNNSLQLLSVIPNNKKHDIHIAEMRLIQDFNSQLISSSSDNMSDDEMLFGTDLNSEALPLLHSFDLSTAFPIENLLSPESIVSTSELNMFNFCEHRSDISAESSVECNNNTKVEQNRDKKSNIVMVASDPVGNLKWVTERASDNSFKNAIESLLAISIGDLQKELQQQLSDGAEKITSQQLRTETISFSVR